MPMPPADCGANAKTPSEPFGAIQGRGQLRLQGLGRADRNHPRKFEEITYDLLDRSRFTTKQRFKPRLHVERDRSRVAGRRFVADPMVRKMLQELSARNGRSVSADEAVAQGADLHAGICSPARREPRGISDSQRQFPQPGRCRTDGKTGRKRNAILIPRNTTLPVTAKRVFKTSQAGQRSILVQIVEGESASPEDCSQLGKCVVRDLPMNLPADTPIEVQFRYADNGRLGIGVKVVGTDMELKHEITARTASRRINLKRGANTSPAPPPTRKPRNRVDPLRGWGASPTDRSHDKEAMMRDCYRYCCCLAGCGSKERRRSRN